MHFLIILFLELLLIVLKVLLLLLAIVNDFDVLVSPAAGGGDPLDELLDQMEPFGRGHQLMIVAVFLVQVVLVLIGLAAGLVLSLMMVMMMAVVMMATVMSTAGGLVAQGGRAA